MSELPKHLSQKFLDSISDEGMEYDESPEPNKNDLLTDAQPDSRIDSDVSSQPETNHEHKR